MTRAVVRKSSLADDDWFIDRSTDWWEEQHDKMITSAHLIPITFINFQDMVHLCHNDCDQIQDRNRVATSTLSSVKVDDYDKHR